VRRHRAFPGDIDALALAAQIVIISSSSYELPSRISLRSFNYYGLRGPGRIAASLITRDAISFAGKHNAGSVRIHHASPIIGCDATHRRPFQKS